MVSLDRPRQGATTRQLDGPKKRLRVNHSKTISSYSEGNETSVPGKMKKNYEKELDEQQRLICLMEMVSNQRLFFSPNFVNSFYNLESASMSVPV